MIWLQHFYTLILFGCLIYFSFNLSKSINFTGEYVTGLQENLWITANTGSTWGSSEDQISGIEIDDS